MEVTAALSAGVFSESAMSAVVEILRRGLGARLCRLWVRDVEGKAFECIAPQGQEPTAEDTARISAEIRGAVSGMVDSWDAIDMHVLMAHEGDRLGLIEVRVPRDGREVMARDVLSVVANVLSPLIASRELSMDLAYEVARQMEKPFFFAEPNEKGDGRVFSRGFSLAPGEKILVVDDVLTTGRSLIEVLELVNREGGDIVGIGVLLDRSGGKVNLGRPHHSLTTLDVESFAPEECPLCREGKPLVKPGSRKF